jgi:hypothetical protein
MISYRANLFDSIKKQIPLEPGDLVIIPGSDREFQHYIIVAPQGESVGKRQCKKDEIYAYYFNLGSKASAWLEPLEVRKIKKVNPINIGRPKYRVRQKIGKEIIQALTFDKGWKYLFCTNNNESCEWIREQSLELGANPI